MEGYMVRPRGDRRRVILDAATLVFSEQGFVGTNLDDVVAAASVSKQTLYKHFADKAALFQEIVLDISNQVDATFFDLPSPDSIEDIDGWINELAVRWVDTIMDPNVQRIRRLVIAEAPRFPDIAASYWDNGFARALANLTEHFCGLTAEGLLTAPDPAVAAEHFVALTLWIPSNRTMFTSKADVVTSNELQTYARNGAATFLRAFARRESAA
jgi:TetR/AcrR family transcriptional repressor of mexJK operon